MIVFLIVTCFNSYMLQTVRKCRIYFEFLRMHIIIILIVILIIVISVELCCCLISFQYLAH